MTYPLSSEVTSGQPTAADHYNNLRKDALYLGNNETDSLSMKGFLNRHQEHMNLAYLSSNRVKVTFDANKPPTIYINGCLLQATAEVDLAAGLISGDAATWYIFAVRTAGSTTFTLTCNTSATESTDQRLIGELYWDGSTIKKTTIKCYFELAAKIPPADYDSGWFAAAYNCTYTKAHSIGSIPRLVVVYYSSSSTGTSEWVVLTVLQNNSAVQSPIGFDSTSIFIQTGAVNTYNAAIYSTRVQSNSGYYRIFAWA